MNNEQKQGFRTLSLASLFLILAISSIALSPLWKSQNETDLKQAGIKAEALAYQVLEGRKSISRGPASTSYLNQLAQDEGVIGLDPWGRPYRFRIFGGGEQEPTKVLVWSMGPDGRADTEMEQMEVLKTPVPFVGDDLGVVVSLKQTL
jgi:hypothetical protein